MGETVTREEMATAMKGLEERMGAKLTEGLAEMHQTTPSPDGLAPDEVTKLRRLVTMENAAVATMIEASVRHATNDLLAGMVSAAESLGLAGPLDQITKAWSDTLTGQPAAGPLEIGG